MSDLENSPNLLLAGLDGGDLDLLRPHLARASLERGQVLVTPDEPVRELWFPEGGVVSIVSHTHDHGTTEVGIFGRDGMSGTCLLLGSDRSPHESFVQVDGAVGWRIDAEPFCAALQASVSLRSRLLRFIQCLMVQMASSAASNAHQRMEARLARWLLMCHDRVDGDDILLTHEFMAMMIAAERSGVTVSLHVLEGIGAIRSRRGRVTVLNRAQLEDLAGDGYGQAEQEYRRLIGPLGRGAADGAANGHANGAAGV